MRRSSAPSHQSLQPTKRGKFVSPFKVNSTQSNDGPSRPSYSGLHPESNCEGLQKEKTIKSKFISNNRDQPCSAQDDGGTKYYTVVWCKASKKKHKKWDSDGILIVHERSVLLKDTEGKDIGQSSGFKSTELKTLVIGSTLVVGNKEIEIIDSISQEMYETGRCFINTKAEDVDLSTKKEAVGGKLPLSLSSTIGRQHASFRTNIHRNVIQQGNIMPRHNPDAIGAVVMPRPSASYQWVHNKNGCAIVDVVLDPYLCTHLRPHQVKGVTFLYKCIMGMGDFNGNGAILADEMGVGKTLQCISLIWTLLKQGPFSGRPVIKRCIIVVPGSLVKNWCGEFKKWLGNERIRTFPIGPNNRIEEFAKSAIYPVMVVSYEMLLRYISDVQNIRFDLIICDEAHRLKNFGIKTTAAIAGLGIKRMVLLTGTPIQNDLKEFYALGQLCNPGIFGTLSSFRQVFEIPISKCQQPNCSEQEEELGNKRALELKRLADLFVLRRTSVVNEQYLPAKVELAVFCNISSLQNKLYQRIIESRAVRSCLSAYSRGSRHFVCIAALKKLCNHPLLIYKSAIEFEESKVLSDDFDEDSLYGGLLEVFPGKYDESFEITHSGKLQVLNRLLDAFKEINEKTVVVSNSTKTLDVFQRLLKMKEREFLRLDGQTSTEERQNLVDRFNSKQSSADIFLLSSKAGGTGLNLIGASRLILYDIDWNPANDIQAMARIWRDGQTKRVFIYRLLTTGTIEEKVFQRQILKQCLSGSVIDLQRDNVQFSREELRDLFTLQESTTCRTHELLGCNCIYMPQDALPDREINLEIRPTQLGVQPCSNENKQLSMAELMSWSHIKPGENTKLKDEVLKRCLENVSFIFQNESGAT